MKNSVAEQLHYILDCNGFINWEGKIQHFNELGDHYENIIETFFENLKATGEIIAYSYDSVDVYGRMSEDCWRLTFSWYDGSEISMIAFDLV